MKNSIKYSDRNIRSPDIEKPCTRTLDEMLLEIEEIIINSNMWEMQWAQLKARGSQTEECWVKNGSLGTMWYMKRKKVIRVQITASELHCDYHKANCAVIAFDNFSMPLGETTKVRNFNTIKRVNSS